MRIATVDALKGVAILLVVLGHAIQQVLPDYEAYPLFRLIYSFHMPLFMLLSGYVVGQRAGGYGLSWIRRRAGALVVPMVAWVPVYWACGRLGITGLSTFMDPSLSPLEFFATYTVESPALWYLPVLFLCSCVLALVLLPKRMPLAVALLAGLVVARLLASASDWLIFGVLQWYFIFFALGVWLRRRARLRSTRAATVLAVVAFPAVSAVALAWLPIAAPPISLGRDALVYYAARLVWALTGIAFAWALTDMATRQWGLGLVRAIGLVTIEIYTTHMLFLGVGIGQGWVRVLSAWVFATTLALASSALLDRFALTRGLLFGRWHSDNPFSRPRVTVPEGAARG